MKYLHLIFEYREEEHHTVVYQTMTVAVENSTLNEFRKSLNIKIAVQDHLSL